MSPGVRPPRRSPKLSGLKQSVRECLDLHDDTTVMISQLACTEPGCPPVETVVAVLPMSGAARRWTLHRPVEEISSDDLYAVLRNSPEGG